MTTRTAINPTSWSINLGFDQAELIEGNQRLLVCSAQDAMDADGNPQHPSDMAAQLDLSLDMNRPGFVGGSRPWKRGWSHAEGEVLGEADDASVRRW